MLNRLVEFVWSHRSTKFLFNHIEWFRIRFTEPKIANTQSSRRESNPVGCSNQWVKESEKERQQSCLTPLLCCILCHLPASQADQKTPRIANPPKWLQIGLRTWKITESTTRQRDETTSLSSNNNFYCLKQIYCLPTQTFIIQTVVTQHHLISRCTGVTFVAFVSYLELGPPVLRYVKSKASCVVVEIRMVIVDYKGKDLSLRRE